jgi:hypothetical protein
MAVNEGSSYYATATHAIFAPHLITDPRHNRHNLFDSEFKRKQLVRGTQAQSVQLSGPTKWLHSGIYEAVNLMISEARLS